MAEQTFRTAMRTTDIIVTATFSPSAVTAIGLADLYARFPLRIGLGLGGGAIALSSQDTGSGASANRDQAVTQALVMGVVFGVPFIFFGWLFGKQAISLLGAPPNVAEMGGLYLAIILSTAPARHVALIGARSLQGTGNTRTPMYINVVSNLLNIGGSLIFGLGLLGMPRLAIVGVGAATAVANVFTAVALISVIWAGRTKAGFTRPEDKTIASQLIRVSAPRIGEGIGSTILSFPYNSLLLVIGGVPLNAAFQIGRRMYQQVTGPLSRGYNVAASVIVGQSLGEGKPDKAHHDGWATAGLGVITVGTIGLVLAIFADEFVNVFTADPETASLAVGFAQVYGLTASLLVVFTTISGSLQGASETRVPLVARLSGMLVCQLGITYLLGVVFNYGALAAYIGAGTTWLWMASGVSIGFYTGNWDRRATDMMVERGSADDELGDVESG
ncbi:MAG: MATE family efflux transporter [Halobacteriaceae archaeon]